MKTTNTTDSKELTMTARDLRVLLTGMRKVLEPGAEFGRRLLFRFGRQVTVSAASRRVLAHLHAGRNPGEEGEMLVPLEALAQMVRALPPREEVRLALKGGRLVASAGRHRQKIRPAGDPVEFPLPSLRGNWMEIGADLREAIVRACVCASRDPTRHVLNSVLLEPCKGGLEVVGTDGCRLYHAGPLDHPLKRELIVPASPVLRWKGLGESWSMRVAGRKGESPFVSIRSGDWTVTAQAIDGQYPRWRQVLPRPRGTTIRFPDPSAVARQLRSLPGESLGIASRDGRVSLLALPEDSRKWEAHRVEGAECSGPPAQLFLKAGFLRQALQFGMTALEVGEAHAPALFTGAGQLVVMPRRVPFQSEQPQP